jgi:hypothetical protein
MTYVHPIPATEFPDAHRTTDVRVDQNHSNLSAVDQDQSNLSAVAWGAVFAGAATAASLWMILMILGTGLGLSSIPLWLNGNHMTGTIGADTADITAGTAGVATIAWLVFSTIAASGMGGYIAGRFRTRWYGVPKDEVWFRDTAHGFLAWAVSALVTAAVLTTMIGAAVDNGIQAGAAVVESGAELAAPRANDGGLSDPLTYYIDSLYRTDIAEGQRYSRNPAVTAESARVFTNALQQGGLPAADVRHLGAMVAEQTGLSQDDAQTRVADTFAQLQSRLKELEANARLLAEQARKAAATAAIWLFISLLSGAFLASLLAIFGGRQRDE